VQGVLNGELPANLLNPEALTGRHDAADRGRASSA
jgi:hypothetical protein